MAGMNGTPAQKRRKVSNVGGSQHETKAATPASASKPAMDARFAMGADFDEEEGAAVPAGSSMPHSLSREPTLGSTTTPTPSQSSPAQHDPLSPSKASSTPASEPLEGAEHHINVSKDGEETDPQPAQMAPGELTSADTEGAKRLRTGAKKQVLSEAKLKRMQMIHDRYEHKKCFHLSRSPSDWACWAISSSQNGMR